MARGPVPAAPAATLVMARAASDSEGLEVLLVRRSERAAFVPGVYVFPGGVVDGADGTDETLARLTGLTPAHAADRLGVSFPQGHAGSPPAIAYYVAALREALEETGILVGSVGNASLPHGPPDREALHEARDMLLQGSRSFAQILASLDRSLDLSGIEYIAHWITPEREPRRYDTRFFLATAPPGAEALPDPRETTDALWMSPAVALARTGQGSLPMILPTVRTLEALAGFRSVSAALSALAGRPVPTILPPSRDERNALPTRRERTD